MALEVAARRLTRAGATLRPRLAADFPVTAMVIDARLVGFILNLKPYLWGCLRRMVFPSCRIPLLIGISKQAIMVLASVKIQWTDFWPPFSPCHRHPRCGLDIFQDLICIGRVLIPISMQKPPLSRVPFSNWSVSRTPPLPLFRPVRQDRAPHQQGEFSTTDSR
jgi:hypothetical protein